LLYLREIVCELSCKGATRKGTKGAEAPLLAKSKLRKKIIYRSFAFWTRIRPETFLKVRPEPELGP